MPSQLNSSIPSPIDSSDLPEYQDQV